MNSYYSIEELEKLGFRELGESNIYISRKCSIYGADKISIGNHVRIDDFCILSGNIEIGNYVHISAYASFFAGDAGIKIGDFVAISSRCAIYAVSDDYSGEYMTNPMVPQLYTNVMQKAVIIDKHVIVGTNTTVLPGVKINEGAAIGAMSLVKRDVDSWTINVGVPCKKIKNRSMELLQLEKEMLLSGRENRE